MIYRARKAQTGYGRPLGILALEEQIPCPPGAPGNPTTFGHPVIYEIVRGVGIDSLKSLNRPDSLPQFLAAGRALVEKGVCAIAGNCGLMILHQQALAAELPTPVFLSSLLHIPLLHCMLGPRHSIGVIASSRNGLKPEHLAMAGVGPEIGVAIAFMDGRPGFAAAMNDGVLDFEICEAEAVAVALELAASNPDLGAIVLECVDLPPYAAAIQEATGLPVFDITTLIAGAYAGLVRRRFVGVY